MQVETKVTAGVLVVELAHRLNLPTDEVQRILGETGRVIGEHLRNGIDVDLGSELRLSRDHGVEILGIDVLTVEEPQGVPARSQDRILFISRREGGLKDALQTRWPRAKCLRDGIDVLRQLGGRLPTAVVFESHVESWREIVQELKCDPATNHVPVIGLFPDESLDEPLRQLTFQPDTLLYEPCSVEDVALALEAEAADKYEGVVEIEMHLPGSLRDRSQACGIVEEVLYRASLPEGFCGELRQALNEALDNAVRHGHGGNETYPVVVRLFLDGGSLVLAVRDSGEGFAHGNAADARVQAAITRKGGIARMLGLVDMVDYNRRGNEIVLTKYRPGFPAVY